jgi:hypothetical protein
MTTDTAPADTTLAPEQSEQAEAQALWDSFAAAENAADSGGDPAGAIEDALQLSKNENTSVESDGGAGNAATPDAGSQKPPAPTVDFEQKFNGARGRLADANRQITELRAALAAATTAAPRREAESSGATGGEDDPLEALRREYPELAEPLVNEIRQLRRTVTDLQGFRQDFTHREVAAQAHKQAKTLAERFPDLAQIDTARKGILLPDVQAEFLDWLNTQPAYVQNVAERNADQIESVEDVADILQRFQATRAGEQPAAPRQALTASPQVPSPRRARQLSDAAAPTGRAAVRVQAGPPDDPAGAWEYFAKLDRERSRA